jgi:hypothetical protein
MAEMCERCKKQGRVWCPHNAALEIRTKLYPKLSRDMFGPTPPNVFVGHNFYPNVYWGPLVSAEQVEDEPSKMYGMGMEEIIRSRSSLVRGMNQGNVKLPQRMLAEAQEAVMSIKPVDVEARFKHEPKFNLELDDVTHPVGASAPIEKFKIAENPSIPKRVDQLAGENVLAAEALAELLAHGFDVHYLTKLLSAGILGKEQSRKMVPTKWAITATDDMAAKRLLETVRYFHEVSEPTVYTNTYLDNHFEVLLLPGNFEYEQFETALTPELERRKAAIPGNLRYESAAWADWKFDGRVNISEEHEPFEGRTAYAERQGGGYYAARFAVVEALYAQRRQARVVVFREIGTNYTVPVGVWEVRENVRHALMSPGKKFNTREEALAHLSNELLVPIKEYVRRSKVLTQRKLTEF